MFYTASNLCFSSFQSFIMFEISREVEQLLKFDEESKLFYPVENGHMERQKKIAENALNCLE